MFGISGECLTRRIRKLVFEAMLRQVNQSVGQSFLSKSISACYSAITARISMPIAPNEREWFIVCSVFKPHLDSLQTGA